MPQIVDGPHQSPHEEQAERLHGSDPGDGRGRLIAQEVAFIIGLKDSVHIDDAPVRSISATCDSNIEATSTKY